MSRQQFRRAAPLVVLPVLILLLLSYSTTRSIPSVEPPSADERIAAVRRAGQTMQALYLVEAQAAESGWTAERLRLAGNLWRDAGDLTRAAPLWEAASQSEPDDVALLRGLAGAYIELQRWAQAANALERLLEGAPDDRWAHLQLGLIEAPLNPRSAVEHLQRAAQEAAYEDIASPLLALLEDDPADSLLPMRVGLALAGQEQWVYAEPAFRYAATVAAPFPEALAYVGLARDNQGKDGGAWTEQAVALDPQSAQARYLLGLHQRRVGEEAASLDSMIRAVSLDPENPALYAELGTAYRLVGDLPRAEYWLRMAALVSNDDPHFEELLALFYAEETPNLTDSGIEALIGAAAQMPDDPDVQAGFGWALYTLGRTEEGLRQLDAALESAPDNPRALYYRGRALLDAGDTPGAVDVLRRVAQADSPFAGEAQRVLESLGY